MSVQEQGLKRLASLLNEQRKALGEPAQSPVAAWKARLNDVYERIIDMFNDPALAAQVELTREPSRFADPYLGAYAADWLQLSVPLGQVLIAPRSAVHPSKNLIGVIEIQYGDNFGWLYYLPALDEWLISRRFVRDASSAAVVDSLQEDSVAFTRDSFASLLADLLTSGAASFQ